MRVTMAGKFKKQYYDSFKFFYFIMNFVIQKMQLYLLGHGKLLLWNHDLWVML
jgi:hypothetical protein